MTIDLTALAGTMSDPRWEEVLLSFSQTALEFEFECTPTQDAYDAGLRGCILRAPTIPQLIGRVSQYVSCSPRPPEA